MTTATATEMHKNFGRYLKMVQAVFHKRKETSIWNLCMQKLQ